MYAPRRSCWGLASFSLRAGAHAPFVRPAPVLAKALPKRQLWMMTHRHGAPLDRSQSSLATPFPVKAPWDAGPAGPLAWAIWLYATRPLLIALALVAATARAIQVGWAEQHAPNLFWVLELVVEPARLLIAVAVLGAGQVSTGLATLRKFWARRHEDAAPSALATLLDWSRIRQRSRMLLAALLAMAAFALMGNWLIGQLAQAPVARTATRVLLGDDGAAGAAAVVLFLKNLSLIPINLIWYGGLYRMLMHRRTS